MNNLAETEVCLQTISKFNLPIWLSYYLADAKHICSGESITAAIKLAKNYSIEYLLINCNPLNITNNALHIISKNWNNKWGIYHGEINDLMPIKINIWDNIYNSGKVLYVPKTE